MDEQQHRRRRHHSSSSSPDVASAPSSNFPAPSPQTKENTPHHDEASVYNTPRRRKRETAPSDPQPSAPQSTEVFWHPESALLDDQVQPPDHQKKEKNAGLFALAVSIDAVICRIGDCFLFVLKWLSNKLMLLAGFVSAGIKKAASFLMQLRSTKKTANTRKTVHTGKRVSSQKPPIDQQVTLEPARPQDYQGMGKMRSGERKKRTVRAPGRKFSVAYCAAMAALICIALVSTVMIGSILLRTIRTKHLSNTLSQRYSELSETSENTDPGVTASPFMPSPQKSTEMIIASMTDTLPDDTQQTPSPTRAPTPEPTAEPRDTVKTTKFHQVGGDALPEMAVLYQENRDLIGWLRMEEILDLPVVYKDNEYYLKRDFYKNKSSAGTLFLDENHPFRENAQNLLLHGHNMKDGTMFGRLVQYETNLQFLKNNPFIQYSTLWKKEQYVIFAVLHVSLDVHSDQFFNYFTHHTFSSDTQFDNYVRSLQTHSVYSIPIDVKPSDALLTLSTCLDDDRLVIVARRVREGESRSNLRHLVQLAAKQ